MPFAEWFLELLLRTPLLDSIMVKTFDCVIFWTLLLWVLNLREMVLQCEQGFAIGSAALVSLALFGAYVSRAGIAVVDVIQPKEFVGLLVGAMLPYWFSAMTMKSVGKAALAMVEEVRRQFRTISGLMEGTAKPDYKRCVQISTDASIREMIPPGALVMLTPIIVGTLFGVETLAGLLAGALVSGVQVKVITHHKTNFSTLEVSKFLKIVMKYWFLVFGYIWWECSSMVCSAVT
jgi:hypothetical protein